MRLKFLLLFFVFSILFKTDNSFDQDLGRHIKLGEIITQTFRVPKTNLFSYTNPDFPFINTHWLFEVMAYFFAQLGTLQLFLVLKIIIILASVWLILKVIPKQNQALLLPIAFIFLHVLRERTELRPEVFSFLFTSLTYFILARFESSIQKVNDRGSFVYQKLIFVLPLIQLIWINTHIYFFVGIALQAIFCIHTLGVKLTHPRGVQRRHLGVLAAVLLLSVILSLANPNGLSGLLYPLTVTKNYGYTIVENQTISFLENIQFRDPNFLFVKLSASLVGLSLMIALFRRQWNIKNILLSVAGLALALMHVRSFPYLVFLSLPAVLQNFGAISRNQATKLLATLAAVLLLFESYFYLNGDYYRFRDDTHRAGFGFEENVKGAMDFVKTHDLDVPIYNNFDIGSYILYKGYPKYQVFIDGRPEAYPAQFFSGVYIPGQSDYKNFKELEKIYNFKTIIFSLADQTPWGKNFLHSVVKDPDWQLVYIDGFTMVLISLTRPDPANVEAVDLAQLSPFLYKFDNHVSYLRMAIFLLDTGNLEPAKAFLQKSLQIFPQSPVANAIIGKSINNYFFW